MVQPIATTWHDEGLQETEWQSGFGDWQEWLAAHQAAAETALALNPPDDAYPITTRWKSGGVVHSVPTSRETGETDDHWIKRHFASVLAEMQTYPPDMS